jgi:hypothetical protein
MDQQQTSVTTGWVVKKQWRDATGKSREKVVSRLYHVQGAAAIYRTLAERSYAAAPTTGETEVKFEVSNDIGFDNLPPRF